MLRTRILGIAALGVATAAAQTIDIGDHFIVSPESNWHFTGEAQPGSTSADDFSWVILNEDKDLGNGLMAAQMLTLDDDSDAPRHLDRDYWELQPDGDLFLHGFWNGTAEVGFPVQDVLLDEPFLFGSRGVSMETVFAQTIDASNVTTGSLPGVATLVLSAEYVAIVPEIRTELGFFTDCLHVVVDISVIRITPAVGSALDVDIPLVQSEIFLKNGVGMVKHDADSSPDSEEVQVIDSGMVAGVPIVADIPKGFIINEVLRVLLGINVADLQFDVNEDGKIDVGDVVWAVEDENSD